MNAAFHFLGEDEDHEPWIHVSPHYMRPGTVIRPGGMPANFENSSREHTYVTQSPDDAEQISYHLWEQGYPTIHHYSVEPRGELEEDPAMPESRRTRDPVEVLEREHRIRRKPTYTSPSGEKFQDLVKRY